MAGVGAEPSVAYPPRSGPVTSGGWTGGGLHKLRDEQQLSVSPPFVHSPFRLRESISLANAYKETFLA